MQPPVLQPSALLDRFDRLVPELSRSRFRVELHREGEVVVFARAAEHVRKVRLMGRAAGLFGLGAGLVLALFLPWIGVSAATACLLVAWLGPRMVRRTELLRIDARRAQIVVLQRAAGSEGEIPLPEVEAVEGAYEVFGWEPRSVVYVKRRGGTRAAVLVFAGTDEELATFVCRTLGAVLGVPARYAGPFGEAQDCFRPAAGTAIES